MINEEELLTPSDRDTPTGLCDQIFDRTIRKMRMQRRIRLSCRISAYFGCFLVGLVAMRLRPAEEPEVRYVYFSKPEKITEPEPPPIAKPVSPSQLELEAEQLVIKAEAARKFREAGDMYFRDYADYRAALRCYRNFLDFAEKTDLESNPGDTLLLASLKKARLEENLQ